METNWAADHLQTIRTLMERSALYRRALAPIMIYVGLLGTVAAILGRKLRIGMLFGDGPKPFVLFWLSVAALGVAGAFLLVRRQALKDSEPFWSPPTRRVAQGLLPPLFVGMTAGLLVAFYPRENSGAHWALPQLWMLLYGCALNAAGFFMTRGIRLFGWLFIACGCGLMTAPFWGQGMPQLLQAHTVMGATFGGLHLAYGVYLYFTEKGKNAA